MEQFLETILPYIKEIAALGTSLVVATLAYLISRLKSKQMDAENKKLKEQLDAAKAKETYIKCPHCNSKLPLSDITFYLPGELKDNNLNGIPDDQETSN